ncbi:MAG: tape measure protein, partial [Cyanobacteriota bacterium]
MVDKKVGINVQLKLDSEAFSRKVDGLSQTFKPIEVPVKLKSLGLNTGTAGAGVRVKADIDTVSLSSSLKTAFSEVTAKLGDDIGERVGKSIEKIKPSAFSGIVGAIASPFQQIATGALEGVGREMSAKLGQGLAKGVEKQTAPVIGSFELLGEKLVTTAAPRLGNTIGGKLAKSLFSKDSVKQAQLDFKQFLTTTVGESDALIASQSQKAREGQRQQGNLTLARRELGTQLADFVVKTPQRQQQTSQLRNQDTQLVAQQQAAQERVTSAQQAIASKREQLAKKQEQILKRLESQGTRIDDTLRAQIAKQVQSAPATVQELAKLEVELAKSSQSLTGIVRQRQTIQGKIKQLSTPVSPIVAQLELLGVRQPEIAAIRERTAKVNQEFDQVINTITSDIGSNISTIQNLRKDIAVYKKQLQNLVDDYNFQLNFTSSDQEKSDLLKQTIQQRNQVIDQIDQAESEIAAAANAASQKQKAREQKQQEKSSVKPSDQDYLAAQARLVRQATGTKQKSSPTGAQLFPDAFPNVQPILENYQKIIEKVGELSGKRIKSSDIPNLTVDPRIKTANLGSYNKQTNSINIGAEDYKKLVSGKISKELIELISHELRHAMQFDYGKNLQGTGVKYVRPSDEELIRLQGRIKGSTDIASKGASPEQRAVVQKTEMDAYTFADRYAQEILNYVKGISAPQNIPSLKTKLTERQRELNATRAKAQEQFFNSIAAENKAALEQLTGKQLTAIARSSGVSGYSNKKVGELRQMLQQQVNPEELAFRIPLFSKVNPQVQQDAQDLRKLPAPQLKQEISETSRYFSQNIKSAAQKKNDPELAANLRLVLDGISEARKVYASALAQDLDEQQRNLLRAAIATLGKQRIAAQTRLTAVSSSPAPARASSLQSVSDLQFSLPAANPLSFADAQSRRDEQSRTRISRLIQSADIANKDTAKLVQQINSQMLSGLISADVAVQKVSAIIRASQAKQDKSAQRRNQATVKSSEVSFKQAQAALKQLEAQVDGQVAQIEARARYNEQQSQRKLEGRLRSYGIDQTAPVDIAEQRPQSRLPSVGKAFNNLRGELQDFRTSGSRKQAQALNQQAQAILVDLDSQIAIGKASVTESEMLQKQVAENEKRIQQIIKKVRAAKEGRVPPLTAGDLQRLSGQLNQLGTQVDADRARVAELDPQVVRARRLQPVANDLRGASSQGSAIASQKNISDKDLARLNRYNQQVRESLKLLGQSPSSGPGGFFADLNLKMPGLLKNVLSLVKGFLAFQVVSLAQQQLQQLGVTAFQASLRFEALEKSLDFASGGQGVESLEFVRKEAERLSLPLETSIKGFTQLTAAARGTSFEGAKTRKMFTAIAQASRVYNLTSEQTEGALLAVTQMISKGTVQAEELRGQLGERIPGAVQIFARALGISTAELGKLQESGKAGLDELDKFSDQLTSETSGGVVGASGTAAASLQRLQNSFADINRQIGDAISPAAIALFDALSNSLDFTQKNAKIVQSALAAVALTVTVALIPSITALGGLLMTFATVTLPFVAKAMLATVAANPVLLASLAALAVGLIVAEDGAKALANALNGVSQAQIDAADSDARLDFKYSEALKQLNKQIPLTKEQIDLLTGGLDDQAKRGVNTARTSELLKNQLLKLQAQAEATAAAQDALNKAVLESETAFKKGKGLAEIYKSRGDLSTAQARARGLIADDAIKDEEYESEQKHNLNMSSLNNARMIDIKNQLAESERLQSSGKKGLEAKQERELREEL